MAIEFECPTCHKMYSVNDELGGRKAQCKQCNGTIRIPNAVAKASDFAPDPVLDAGTQRPRRSRSSWSAEPPRSVRDRQATRSASSPIVLIGGLFFLIMFISVLSFSWTAARPVAPPPLPPPLPPSNLPTTRVTGNVIPAAQFPPRGKGRILEQGIRVYEVTAKGDPNQPTTSMTAWLYVPDRVNAVKSLPCVVIAPAGTVLLTGIDLADGDRPEHVPYVRAGYAVLAYSLDGPVDNSRPQQINADLVAACDKFVAANAGLLNADAAIRWMLKSAPEVDPQRLFAAGHSSAGTMALVLCENDARIRACAAFAPRSDVMRNFPGNQRAAVLATVPNSKAILYDFNPAHHIGAINCPVFLFQARDDDTITSDETSRFARTLSEAGKRVTLEFVDEGGHYDPMITTGIPHAIDFFNKNGSGLSNPKVKPANKDDEPQ